MKKLFFIGIFLLTVFTVCGQIKSDTIEIKKSFGTVFRQNGKNLTPKQLMAITSSNPEAYKEMKIAKSNYDFGSVIGFAGGFMVGWPVGTALAGGDANWTLAGIGAGLICISIPFSTAYTKHTKNAVEIYNNQLRQTGFNQVDFKVGLTCNGIGIKVNF
jgi:hypothetical protein